MDNNQPKIIQLLNLSTQLDNHKTNLGQPITKQCLILFSLWCKKVALAIKKQNMVRSKYFLIPDFTGSSLYEEFLGITCHSSLYFAIFTYIYEL